MKEQGIWVWGTPLIIFLLLWSGCTEEQRQLTGDMTISSPVFQNEGTIPVECTCDGADISPPLLFTSIPNSTKSLALMVNDIDASSGSWMHWLVWNIPVNTTGFSKGENIVFPEGQNDFGTLGYGGPCPPENGNRHRYVFTLYALDTLISLTEGATKTQVESSMAGHIIEEAQLTGIYQR